jgi:hypothetical protein
MAALLAERVHIVVLIPVAGEGGTSKLKVVLLRMLVGLAASTTMHIFAPKGLVASSDDMQRLEPPLCSVGTSRVNDGSCAR